MYSVMIFVVWKYSLSFRVMVKAINLLLLLKKICLFSLFFFTALALWKRSEGFIFCWKWKFSFVCPCARVRRCLWVFRTLPSSNVKDQCVFPSPGGLAGGSRRSPSPLWATGLGVSPGDPAGAPRGRGVAQRAAAAFIQTLEWVTGGWGTAKYWALARFVPDRGSLSKRRVSVCSGLGWLDCSKRRLCVPCSAVTDNGFQSERLSSMWTQHDVLQYSTAGGIYSQFLAFSACFPLIYETFLGYFNTPVTFGLRGDKPLLAGSWCVWVYLV